MVTPITTKINGVNVDQLVQTVQAIQGDPGIANFTFRAHTTWVEGGHSRTTIQSFYGAKSEDTTRQSPFVIDGDEPPVLLGQNLGPNSVEALLQALGSCLTVGFIYNAAAQGIHVEKLELSLEGDLDLQGFLGLSDTVRPGYQSITVNYRLKSDAPRDKVEALCNYVQKTSPVMDMLRNPVTVNVNLID